MPRAGKLPSHQNGGIEVPPKRAAGRHDGQSALDQTLVAIGMMLVGLDFSRQQAERSNPLANAERQPAGV